MADAVTLRQRIAIRLGAILGTILASLGALGLATLYLLPWWMLGLITAAGLNIGALASLPLATLPNGKKGTAHFPGFLKELQALDPAIRLQSLRWVLPMSFPNEPEAPAGYPVTR